MALIEKNAEVLVSDGTLTVLGRADIDLLLARLPAAPRGRVRICAHASDDAPLHEMIIALAGGRYIRPHRHRGKAESFHLIQGVVDIVFFDEAGAITAVLPMADTAGFGYYRIDDAAYHTLVVRTPAAVYHEVTTGPFRRGDTEFPLWSPEEGDPAVASWLQDLDRRMHAWTAARS